MYICICINLNIFAIGDLTVVPIKIGMPWSTALCFMPDFSNRYWFTCFELLLVKGWRGDPIISFRFGNPIEKK